MKRHLFARLQQSYRDRADDGTGQGASGGGGSGGGSGGGQPQDGDTQNTNNAGAGNTGDGESGGKKPTDEEARLLKEVMKRKEEAKTLKDQLDQMSGIQKTLEELGGLDAIKELVSKKKADEIAALEAKGEYGRLKEAMAAEHAKELKEWKDKVAERDAALAARESQLVELTIGQQFNASRLFTHSPDAPGETLLTPNKARQLYGAHFDFVDGQVVGYDKPRGAADRTPLVDASGKPQPFDVAVRKVIELDPDKDFIFRPKGKSGAGSDSSRRTEPTKSNAELSGVERISVGLQAKRR